MRKSMLGEMPSPEKIEDGGPDDHEARGWHDDIVRAAGHLRPR